MPRSSKFIRLLAIASAMLAFGVTASATAAIKTHVLDETLSLSGNCSTSPQDLVPDPGICPMPPGVKGVDHPPKGFVLPNAVTTDAYGNIYVGSGESEATEGAQGRIDIFNSKGEYITEVADPSGPSAMAIDGEGNLYVGNRFNGKHERLVRYSPLSPYEPALGKISYDPTALTIAKESASNFVTVAINPTNDRLLVTSEIGVREYKSAAESSTNEFIEEIIGIDQLHNDGLGLAVDASRGRLYASTHSSEGDVVKAFALAAPHALLFTIKPPIEAQLELAVAADEGSGHVFVYDGKNGSGDGPERVYEFDQSGSYLGDAVSFSSQSIRWTQIAVDNGVHSPNGALNPFERYLFVPGQPNHVYAFGPAKEHPPVIESSSTSGITEDEAILRASVNPEGVKTDYRFEYTTQAHYEDVGNSFIGATLAKEGSLAAGGAGISLQTPLAGLSPATAYRFHVVAENELGNDEAEGEFSTYRPPAVFGGCSNEALRTGFSTALPDCRVYELVTPSNTNGNQPYSAPHFEGPGTTLQSRGTSPTGDTISFVVEGGGIPGYEVTGGLKGDPYRSERTSHGWQTIAAGPNGAEAENVAPGGFSADQGYSLLNAGGGSLAPGFVEATFLRYPDGHFAPLGRGDLGTDPKALGKHVSPGGRHVIFTSNDHLETAAPPAGAGAIYDRTIDPETGEEQTHVVSLLEGDVTPTAGEHAEYVGASLDGRGVAFQINRTVGSTTEKSPLYLRYDNETTYEVAPKTATFAGIAEGGSRFFYLEGGDLWRFNADDQSVTRFTESGDVTVANVSADGSTAYFVSPSVLPSLGSPAENPLGAVPQLTRENLYRSHDGQISFLGTVTERDVKGEFLNIDFDGIGLWVGAVRSSNPGADSSRSTPEGSTFLFQSRAELTGYDSGGRPEVYRYDSAGAGGLSCLSCNPTRVPVASGSRLFSMSGGWGFDTRPLSRFADLENLRPDGKRAFFESTEALVAADTDGVQDVYEWEDRGVGSCHTEGGCVYLISSGESAQPNYLYAVSETGDDVFIETPDLLLGSEDPDEAPSIYDARVNGGFPPPATGAGECLGEACQPQAHAPDDPTLTSSSFHGAGNVSEEGSAKSRCPKGKRKVRKTGKARCVKRHARKHRRGVAAKTKRRTHR